MTHQAEQRYSKKTTQILDHTMAYIETGSGDPIVFLHGNPTSSYLWRNIIPHVESLGRCIAPDLIGMGDSQKLEESGPDRYRFEEHSRFVEAFLADQGVLENAVLVIHDWGSALGFDWACRHRDAVKGIAYMEAIVSPLTWAEWPKAATAVFQGFRSPAGEKMVLEDNTFVEGVLPTSILRKLTDDEMDAYRAPFKNPGEDRRPTLSWPREIPIEGEPANVVELVERYGAWLKESNVPKLFFDANPGAILRGRPRDFCRSWPNQTEVEVAGIHFVQEDSPDEIGSALASWIQSLS